MQTPQPLRIFELSAGQVRESRDWPAALPESAFGWVAGLMLAVLVLVEAFFWRKRCLARR